MSPRTNYDIRACSSDDIVEEVFVFLVGCLHLVSTSFGQVVPFLAAIFRSSYSHMIFGHFLSYQLSPILTAASLLLGELEVEAETACP